MGIPIGLIETVQASQIPFIDVENLYVERKADPVEDVMLYDEKRDMYYYLDRNAPPNPEYIAKAENLEVQQKELKPVPAEIPKLKEEVGQLNDNCL
jgi:hypothetical protein